MLISANSSLTSNPPLMTGTVENSTAKPSIPVIEVVGTWDDLVIREVLAYAQRVEPKDRHRLYQVEGVWHMSGDDDGVQGFQYAAETRLKLDKDVADAMGEGPSYIPTVRKAFDHLVRWAETVRAQAEQWDETWVFFKHEEEGKGPEFARIFLDALGK